MRTYLGPDFARLRAIIGLLIVIIVPIVCAEPLNAWSFFAFPLGSFCVAVLVPLGIILVAMAVPRSFDEETFDR